MRRISFFLILIIIVSYIPAYAEISWPSDYGLNGREMPSRPYDKYVTSQNPPDFSWGFINDAVSYDLIVASDKNLTDIRYSVYGIKNNYYNFSYPFEKNTYYWSVRFHTKNATSDWLSPKRFTISEDAVDFIVPDINTLKNKINATHPRMFFDKNSKDEFINSFSSKEGSEYLKRIKCEVTAYMNSKDYTEPSADDYNNADELFAEVRVGTVSKLSSAMMKSALLYIIKGEDIYGQYAKRLLLNISGWDTEGITSYVNDDMTCRDILLNSTVCYDWIYNLLDSEEKIFVQNMIKKRGEDIYYDLISSNRDTCIKISPYNSHGVTALGFLLASSVAMFSDIPEAEKWFEDSVLLYINVIPVWGNEDGGFSQGTYYYHTAHKYTINCVLKEAGIINLNLKPYFRNEYLFPLYMYPKNSYGAFGDYSYVKATDNIQYIYSLYSKEQNNGAAKWLSSNEGEIDDYYSLEEGGFAINGMTVANQDNDIKPEIPADYPKAHLFKDVGMAAFHSDLIDENRISLYFKSGPFGSYNHSHADQNTFVIEAFGERLAIDSGYYAYGTDWENLYVRQTYAHNGITFDDECYGQLINTMKAKGKIEEFITSEEFDIVSGDASEAYGGPEYMKRKIIYVRPDSYIIIDEMKNGNKLPYQFWLNGMKDSIKNRTDNSVSLVNGKAQLDLEIIYPSVTSDASYDFTLPDKTPVERPSKYKNSPSQERVCFKTEGIGTTKMVTLVNVHRSDKNGIMPEIINKNDYIVFKYPDGTNAYVNLSFDKGVTSENISFEGDAYIYKNNSRLLLSGKKLMIDNRVYFEGEKEFSAYTDGKCIKISTDDDNVISADIREGIVLAEKSIIKGNHTFGNSDNKEVTEASFSYSLNGRELKIPMASYNKRLYGNLNNYEGYYRVEDISEGVSLKNAVKGEIIYLERNNLITLYGEGNHRLSLMPYEEYEYSDGYSEISLAVEGEGEIYCDSYNVKNGTNANIKIVPDEGWYIDSVKFNGNNIFPDALGNIKTPAVKNKSVLSVVFKETNKENPVYIYDEIYYPDNRNFIAFGGIKDYGIVSEYGIATSKTEEFLNPEFYKSKTLRNPDGQYGIKLNADKIYVKAYAVKSGKTYFSEKTLFADNDYSAVMSPAYTGKGKDKYNIIFGYGGSLKEHTPIYSNMIYQAKHINDFLLGNDYISFLNPVTSDVESEIKSEWNGEFRNYFSFDVYESGMVCVLTSGQFLPLETAGFVKHTALSDTGYIRKYNPPWNTYHNDDLNYMYTKYIHVEEGEKKTVNLPNAAWYDLNKWGYFVVFMK